MNVKFNNDETKKEKTEKPPSTRPHSMNVKFSKDESEKETTEKPPSTRPHSMNVKFNNEETKKEQTEKPPSTRPHSMNVKFNNDETKKEQTEKPPSTRPHSMNVKFSKDETKKEQTEKPPSTRQHSMNVKHSKDESKKEPPEKTPETQAMMSTRKDDGAKQANDTTCEDKKADVSPSKEKTEKDLPSNDAPEENYENRMESNPSDHVQEPTQENTTSANKREPLYTGVSAVTVVARSSELQRRPPKSPRHLRCGPKKKPYFVNSPDITSTHGSGRKIFYTCKARTLILLLLFLAGGLYINF
jgi:hypothetical protein